MSKPPSRLAAGALAVGAVLERLSCGVWITAAQLAECVGLWEGKRRESKRRRVREAIEALRWAGVPVEAHTRHGYRLAPDQAAGAAWKERVSRFARGRLALGGRVAEAAQQAPRGSQLPLPFGES